MKQTLTLFLCLLVSISVYGQTKFQKGYFINNNQETVNCFIRNNDWNSSPKSIRYKLTEDGEVQTAKIETINSFAIEGICKYIKSEVSIDKSSNSLSELGPSPIPVYKKERIMLKVLIDGPAKLYTYKDNDLKLFFFETENIDTITQLIYKGYRTPKNIARYNELFKKQLANNLKCKTGAKPSYKNLRYDRKELVRVFVKNNTCNSAQFADFSKTSGKASLNISLKARALNSGFAFQVSNVQEVDFGNETNVGIGVEFESVLPFNNGKWGVVAELNYQQANNSSLDIGIPGSSRDRTLTFNHNYFEIDLGVRHYFFLSPKSKLFLNAFWALDSPLDSKITSIRGVDTRSTIGKIRGSSSLAFGGGYKYNEKISAEIRYFRPRNILGDDPASEFSSIAFVLGYTIF